MSRLGRSYLELNRNALEALDDVLSPEAREAARQMFAPPAPPVAAPDEHAAVPDELRD